MAPSYKARILRLTLLVSDMVESSLSGRHGPDVTLLGLLEPLPTIWTWQMELFD